MRAAREKAVRRMGSTCGWSQIDIQHARSSPPQSVGEDEPDKADVYKWTDISIRRTAPDCLTGEWCWDSVGLSVVRPHGQSTRDGPSHIRYQS